MTVLSLDQSAWRRALRELDDDHRHWFQLVATTTAEALSEGRSCIVTTNNLEIFDCCRRLAQHLGASVEIVERADGLTDLIFSPPSRRKARPVAHERPTVRFRA